MAQQSRVETIDWRRDWMMVVVCAWLLAGFYADTWAHIRVKLETFLTVWHALLYSGWTAIGVLLLGFMVAGRLRGRGWRQAIPDGYDIGYTGFAVLIASGVGDVVWHWLFGIEQNMDALLSPNHLGLFIGGALTTATPIAAAWQRPDIGPAGRPPIGWPALIAAALIGWVIAIPLQPVHPFGRAYPSGQLFAIGPAGVILHTAVMIGTILVLLQRWHFPLGRLTILVATGPILMATVRAPFIVAPIWSFIAVAVFGGVAAEVLNVVLRLRTPHRPKVRLFSATLPAALYTAYFLACWMTSGIQWSVHASVGTIVLGVLTGWVTSVVAFPPRLPSSSIPAGDGVPLFEASRDGDGVRAPARSARPVS